MKRIYQLLIVSLALFAPCVAQSAFRFTAWSDNHITYPEYRANFDWVALEMQRILTHDGRPIPGFHISGGDCENGGHTLTSTDLGIYCPSFSSWSYVPSNHDTDTWGSSNYADDYGDTLIIFLNLYECPDGVCDCSEGRICSHTLAWLATQLDGSHPFAFVVGHEPAYPNVRHVGDSLDLYPTERDAFWQLLSDRGVLAYLCGHTHQYEHTQTGNTHQIILGNAGHDSGYGQTFVVFDVTDNGYVDVTVYMGSQGEEFTDGDRFQMSPPQGPPQATLLAPADGGSSDLNSSPGEVTVNATQSNFQIKLYDVDGIADGTVTPNTVSIAGLTSGTHYAFAYDGSTDIITLTPLADAVFGNGTYTITVSGISDSAIPAETMTDVILTVEIDTSIVAPLHFQYSTDTMIHGGYPNNSYSGSQIITADSSDAGWASHVLLRFDDIIGDSPDRIPWGASILSATLRLRSLDAGSGGSLHAMLQSWEDTDTWNSLLGGDGIQADDAEAVSVADDGIGANSSNSDVDLDVTNTVQAWASGMMANYGWVVLPGGSTDGWDIASGEHATTGYRPELIVTFTGGEPIYIAHNPSPANGATRVPMNAQLQWAPGTGAIGHDVYLWTGGTPVRVSPRQAGTTYTPPQLLAGETTYSWRIDEYYTTDSGETPATGDEWTFTTGPEAIVSKAASESTIKGELAGSYADTEFSDNAYETITEVLSVPNKNGYSTLEHIWRFDVPAGTYVEFSVEASRSASTDGDDFDFSYSTDGTTYHYMLTAASTTDTVQSFTLPSNTAGTVYVKATDTNQTKGATATDVLSVDFMCIVSSQIPIVTYNYKASNPNPSDGATSVPVDTSLSWTAGDQTITHRVYFGTDQQNLPLVTTLDLSETSYTPGSLEEGTTYYWRVDEVRLGDQVETGDVWSFTTYVTPGEPTSLSVSVTTSLLRIAPPNDYGVATVTVVDNYGMPVSGAVVTGHFTGDFSDERTGSTDANGQIVFQTGSDYKKPMFDFVVTKVTYGSLTWPEQP